MEEFNQQYSTVEEVADGEGPRDLPINNAWTRMAPPIGPPKAFEYGSPAEVSFLHQRTVTPGAYLLTNSSHTSSQHDASSSGQSFSLTTPATSTNSPLETLDRKHMGGYECMEASSRQEGSWEATARSENATPVPDTPLGYSVGTSGVERNGQHSSTNLHDSDMASITGRPRKRAKLHQRPHSSILSQAPSNSQSAFGSGPSFGSPNMVADPLSKELVCAKVDELLAWWHAIKGHLEQERSQLTGGDLEALSSVTATAMSLISAYTQGLEPSITSTSTTDTWTNSRGEQVPFLPMPDEQEAARLRQEYMETAPPPRCNHGNHSISDPVGARAGAPCPNPLCSHKYSSYFDWERRCNDYYRRDLFYCPFCGKLSGRHREYHLQKHKCAEDNSENRKSLKKRMISAPPFQGDCPVCHLRIRGWDEYHYHVFHAYHGLCEPKVDEWRGNSDDSHDESVPPGSSRKHVRGPLSGPASSSTQGKQGDRQAGGQGGHQGGRKGGRQVGRQHHSPCYAEYAFHTNQGHEHALLPHSLARSQPTDQTARGQSGVRPHTVFHTLCMWSNHEEWGPLAKLDDRRVQRFIKTTLPSPKDAKSLEKGEGKSGDVGTLLENLILQGVSKTLRQPQTPLCDRVCSVIPHDAKLPGRMREVRGRGLEKDCQAVVRSVGHSTSMQLQDREHTRAYIDMVSRFGSLRILVQAGVVMGV